MAGLLGWGRADWTRALVTAAPGQLAGPAGGVEGVGVDGMEAEVPDGAPPVGTLVGTLLGSLEGTLVGSLPAEVSGMG